MIVYIIIPVYNRKNITLECLKKINEFNIFSWCNIVIVDDGSTDGTALAIKEIYPQVHIIQGDGNLWWGGAISLGMKYAFDRGADYFIWLNDDCLILEHTIPILLQASQASNTPLITGAKCLDISHDFMPSYGGILKHKCRVQQVYSGECDGLAGNLVCLPRLVIKTIGYPDYKNVPHYYSDVIYTNQAKKNGFKLWVVDDAITYCEDTNKTKNWLNRNYSLVEIIAERFSKASSSYWRARMRYDYQFLGLYGLFRYVIWEWMIKISLFSILGILERFLPIDQVKRKLKKQIR